MRLDLVDQLESWIVRAVETGDPALVLDPRAAALAAELLADVAPGGQLGDVDVRTANALATYHWMRWGSGSEDEERDLALTLGLFAAVYALDPEMVPPSIREVLEDGPEVGEEDDDEDGDEDGGLSGGLADAHDRALALVGAYQDDGDPAGLDEAVDLLQRVADGLARDHPRRPTVLANLAIVVEQRLYRAGARADLDRVVALWREALATIAAGDDAQRARYLSSLGIALHSRFRRLLAEPGSEADLAEAIEVSGQAAALAAGDTGEGPRYLANLAIAWRANYDVYGDVSALDRATEALAEAVRVAPPDHPDRPSLQATLANTWRSRFGHTGELAQLDRAIDLLTEAAAVAGQHQGLALANLGSAVRERFRRTGDPDDLGRGVDAARRAVALIPAPRPDSAFPLAVLASVLYARFELAGEPADIDEAVAAGRRALELIPPDGPQFAPVSTTVCLALRSRFERTGDLADLDLAVALGRRVAGGLPPGHTGRPTCLSNLGGSLEIRFRRTGNRADIDEAVDVSRESVAAVAGTDPDRPTYLIVLCAALLARFDHAGIRTDLDAAIAAGAEAYAAVPVTDPLRAIAAINVGLAYLVHSEYTGDLSTLDSSVEAIRVAVAATPPGHPDRRRYLSDLAGALRTRGERTGRLSDVDDGVAAGRDAIAATPADHPRRHTALVGLANALSARFERTGVVEDIDEAIAVCREAAGTTTADQPDHAAVLTNLGSALRTRYRHTGSRVDLDAAVDAVREATTVSVGEPAGRWLRLANLCVALLDRVAAGAGADADEAVATGRAALAACPPDQASRPGLCSNLGVALRHRWLARRDPHDLDEAVSLLTEAAATAESGHPGRAGYGDNLGAALKDRFRLAGDRQDLDRAVTAWREAAADAAAPADVRLNAAASWGTAAAEVDDAASAADGFAAAVALLPLLAWPGLQREVRERQLTRWPGLAGAAAAWAIRAGDPRRAVELLEQGRSVLWNQAFQTRGDLSALHAAVPELGRRLDEVRATLDAAPADYAPVDGPGRREDRARDHRRLVEQWDALLAEVRRLDGFADFLGATPFDRLRHVGDLGPVVIVTISTYGCAALALTEGDVTVVPLPAVTAEEIARRADALRAALHSATGTRRILPLLELRDTLLSTLDWLRAAVVRPVFDRLGLPRVAGGEPATRLWWCPTGPLTLLPLHAAVDSVIASQTPTLTALLRARTAGPPRRPPRLLAVGLPETPGHPDLPGVLEEMGKLAADIALVGPAATRDRVVAALTDVEWAHLACHGGQDLLNPGRSALSLHDGPLTVAEVAAARLPHAELAFLSACHTAAGGVTLTDEAIHLGAALQFAGYRHVVATLWAISDAHAPDVAEQFYARMGDDAGQSARALHAAVGRVRAAAPLEPEVWAPYLHLGP